MADLSDIENALVAVLAGTVFYAPLRTPAGDIVCTETGQIITLDGGPGPYVMDASVPVPPSYAVRNLANPYLPLSYAPTVAQWTTSFPGTSIAPGSPVVAKLYRGWPESANLDRDMAAGYAHISVFPEPGMARNVTRFMDIMRAPIFLPTTLTATAAGNTVTYGGTCVTPHLVGVGLGAGNAPATYSLATVAGDTPATVAAKMAALIPGASAAAAVLTCPSELVLYPVASVQTGSFETRRQQQSFRISTWHPTPLVRDALMAAIDGALSQIRRFTLADGTSARLIFQSAFVDDKPSKDRVWRRDARWQVEYPTTIAAQLFPALWGGLVVNTGGVLTNIGQLPPSSGVIETAAGPVLDFNNNLVGVP